MQPIAHNRNVLFVNNSKATNADSTAKALASFHDIFWIAGGKPKTGGIESLAKFFPRIAKAYLIRRSDGRIRQDAGRQGALRKMRRAVRRRRCGGARRRGLRPEGAGGAAVAGLRLVRPVPEFRGAR